MESCFSRKFVKILAAEHFLNCSVSVFELDVAAAKIKNNETELKSSLFDSDVSVCPGASSQPATHFAERGGGGGESQR